MPAASRPIQGRGQATAAAPSSRRGEEQQPQGQWRSSLDIVFSYSRSQAFYGQNLNTSPSFAAEARWRGPHGDDTDAEGEDDDNVGEEDSLYQDEDDEDDATSIKPSINGDEDGLFPQPLDFGTVDSSRTATSAAPTSSATENSPLLLRSKRASRSSLSHQEQQRRRSSAVQSNLSHPHHSTPAATGSSTFGQTLFNCVNALAGVGILSLPLALSYAGMPLGIILFIIAGLITNYTGKLLHKIMMSDPSLATYADIGRLAFGEKSRVAVTLLFCSELWAVSVALLVLFGDSIAAVLPAHTPLPGWLLKVAGFAVVLPTCFMPMRLLSPISLVGIFTTCSLLLIVFVNGSVKTHSPGSLWQPMPDSLDFTPQWGKLPLAFGLIMSGFSSHPIIPSLVRDMRQPERFPRMLDTAYVIATILYLSMGIAGYLMFGRAVSDEITQDLAGVKEYPRWTTHLAVGLIAAVSVSKFALALRPVQTTVEGLVLGGVHAAVEASEESQIATDTEAEAEGDRTIGHDDEEQHPISTTPATPASLLGLRRQRSIEQSQQQQQQPQRPTLSHASAQSSTSQSHARSRAWRRFLVTLLLPSLVLVTAILLPGFASLMSFLGSVLAGLSCICGPLAAHLVVFGPRRGKAKRRIDRRVSGASAKRTSGLSVGPIEGQEIEDDVLEDGVVPGKAASRRPSASTMRSTHTRSQPHQALGPLRRAAETTLIVLAAIMAVLGTVWSALPVGQAA